MEDKSSLPPSTDYSTHPSTLLSVAEMYQANDLALKYVESSYLLMQRAAIAVADRAQAITPLNDETQILLLCGKGNNCNDVFPQSNYLQIVGIKSARYFMLTRMM